MKEIADLIKYLKSLIDSLYYQCFSLEEPSEITKFIYEYMLDDSKDFSEFDKDYYDCQEYDKIDKKECLQNIMYAVYFMLKFYYGESKDLYENIFLDDCSDMEIRNNLDELFVMEEFGTEIVDNFLLYFDYSEAKRKNIALNLIKNKEFIDLFKDDKYVMAVLANDINLEIPEVALLVNEISDIYDLVNPDKIYDVEDYTSVVTASADIQSDYDGLAKVRKKLIAKSLAKESNIQTAKKYIQHLFSIILKSNYINIYNKKINDPEVLTSSDYDFFNLINDGIVSFDELFDRFTHDNKFSAYLLGSFYFDNIDKNLVDFEGDEAIYQKNSLGEKIKKYYIQ